MIIQGEIKCFEKTQDKIELFDSIWHRNTCSTKEDMEKSNRNCGEFLSKDELAVLKNKEQEYIQRRTFAQEFFHQMISSEQLYLDMKDVELQNAEAGLTKGKLGIHRNNQSIEGATSFSRGDSGIILSHGKNCWVGVDVQEITTGEAEMKNESIFSFEERNLIDYGENKGLTATLILGIKEAVGKALEVGLCLGVKSISVLDIREGQIWINLIPETENILLDSENRLIVYYEQQEETFFVICCMLEKEKQEV